MGRPKKSAPKHVEPEDESQDLPEEEPEIEEEEADESEPVAAQPSMSKADACRAALAAGIETTEEAMEFTRSKFGVEIKPTDFTLYKSKAKGAAASSRKAEPAKRGRKPKAAASPEPAPSQAAPVARAASNGSQPDLMTALEGVKELVGQFGADQVKRMVDLLG